MSKTKKILCCVFALVMTLLALFPLAGTSSVHAESLRSKKVVSVVYDDSGSMSGSNWPYANYAMQTFVAMLNDDDDLYITYMSDPGNPQKIRTDDLLSAVNDIRNHSDSSGTPYESVSTAMDQLSKVNDTNPSTQYWLVVFTDGGFNDESTDNVARDLDNFYSKKMANGTTPQIMFMTIGDTEDYFTPHPSNKDITVIKATGADDVRDSLFDIASRVSGRIQVDDRDIILKDDRTVSVSSNVPLFKISILVQNTENSVKSIKDSENQDIPIISEIPIEMPEESISGVWGIDKMFGVVTLAGESQNIPAGNYTITFSEPVSKDDIVIMFEPAVQLRIKITIDGVEVTDFSDIPVTTEHLCAEAAIYEYGTDNLIMESLLPGKVDKEMTFSVDGNTVDSTPGFEMNDIVLAEGENVIRATLDISGFFHLEAAVRFTPSLIPPIDRIDAELYYDGSPRAKNSDGSTDADNVVYISQLKSNRTGIRFTVYTGGNQIDYATAKAMESEFKAGIYADFKNYKVEVQSDGSYLVYPSRLPFYMPWELYFMSHNGDQTVGVKIDSASAEGVLDFKLFASINDAIGHYLLHYGVLLVVLAIVFYAVLWVLKKNLFPKCTVFYTTGTVDEYSGQVTYDINNRSSVSLNRFGRKTNNLQRFRKNLLKFFSFISLKTSHTTINGYTIYGQWACRDKSSILLVGNVKDKYVSDKKTKPVASDKCSDETVSLADVLYIYNGKKYLKFEIIVRNH